MKEFLRDRKTFQQKKKEPKARGKQVSKQKQINTVQFQSCLRRLHLVANIPLQEDPITQIWLIQQINRLFFIRTTRVC